MTKKEFYYPSSDKEHQIHAIAWLPDEEVCGIVQILHGMAEYIDRYDEFATYLAGKGFVVVGNDHLGHGLSVKDEEDYGYFHEPDGNRFVLSDIHRLYGYTSRQYPGVPYFMLGHSMGSFLLREYLTMDDSGLSGAIIMGTGYQPLFALRAGRMLCRTLAAVRGWHYRSKLVDHLGMGGYNRKFEPAESKLMWLNSNEERRRQYEEDPMCGFVFTLNGYYEMFTGMMMLTDKKCLQAMDKTLPVFFVSGENDPVGDFGEGVRKVYEQFLDVGMQDVEMKLYRGDRHEILNETDRNEVYEDLYLWLEEHL